MRFCIFEDRAESLEPLSLTRPLFDLRCGMTTLAHKLLRHVAGREWGVLIRSSLEDLQRTLHPEVPVNDAAWLQGDDLLLLNGRWLPPRTAFEMPAESCVGMLDENVAYVLLRRCDRTEVTPEQLPALVQEWRHALPARTAAGSWIGFPWDLVRHNESEIQRDFSWPSLLPCAENPGLTVIGPRDRLWVSTSAVIEPLVVADTTGGPVYIDEGASISAFTRLEGPCCIGPGSQVHGAKIRAGTTLGPQCRVGGEVEASILHGYSNKYHDGFLGHSYVGAWVNLAAGTQSSDLRNDYGEVAVTLGGTSVPTGMTKVGCFLGDHTKTGLGTLFNTGTNVGAFCHLLPAGRYAPRYVPSFASWWNGALCEAFTLEQLLATAQTAMQRRSVTLTAAHRDLYARLLRHTAPERRRVLRDAEPRHLRRSA